MDDATDAAVDLAFDDGLLPVVAQDVDAGDVLMVAYASPEAVERTVETGLAHYYSRSREELWQKGASSGHEQHVESVRVDCDADTLLYLVEQAGGACHTGHRSCFYREVEGLAGADGPSGDPSTADPPTGDGLAVTVGHVGERVFDPDAVYGAD